MKILSIIVPLYNEAETISLIIGKLIDLEITGWDKEIIVVDDSSTDASSQIIKKFSDNIIYIRHLFNQGKGAAIKTGLVKASGQAVLIQDADFEYDPADIPALLKAFSASNAVYGSRNLKPDRQGYLPYVWGVGVLTSLVNLFYKQKLTDVYTGYKLFPTSVIKKMSLTSTGFEFEMEVTLKLLKAGIGITEVPISYQPRKFSQGKKIRARDGLKGIVVLIRSLFD